MKKVSPEEILELCHNIHRNPDDFIDGDIEERIFKASSYTLTTACPQMIEDEWAIDEDLVEKYMTIPLHTVPPIILHKYSNDHYSIVDGSNRIEAFKRMGITSIPAYIGKVEL